MKLANIGAIASVVPPASGYDYGYPAGNGGGVQPNVVAQWTLQESASPIVDKVTSLTCNSEYGPMTYSQASNGLWLPKMTPGISFPGSALFGDFLANDGTACSLGLARDAVLEVTGTLESGPGDYCSPFSCERQSDSHGWYLDLNNGTQGKWYVQFTAEDDSYLRLFDYWVTDPTGDGLIHNFRLKIANSLCFLYMDNILQNQNTTGGLDISALAGKQITSTQTRVGAAGNGNHPYHGKLFEVRVTIGNSTNNSKP